MKHFALLLMFTLPTACSPPEDGIFEISSALTTHTINSPWGDVAQEVWVGVWNSGPGVVPGHNGALYRKRDGSNGCWWVDFGTPSGNYTAGIFEISVSNQADRAWISGHNQGVSCSFGNVVLDYPNVDQAHFWMIGGDDECHVGAMMTIAESSNCHGQDGNDKIYVSNAMVGYGDAGNDSIVDLSGFGFIYGGDGNDCLTWYQNQNPITRDGGPGTDTSPLPSSATSTEVQGLFYVHGGNICNLD